MDIPARLSKIIFWLQTHPLINAILALGYFLLILFLHAPLVIVSIWVEHHLSIDTYNLVIEVVFVLMVLLLLYTVAQRVRINFQNLKLEMAYMILSLLFIIIHSRFMFDSNIEVIHSLEFTILAFLLFPFTKRFGAAIFCTLPFMLFDEWYQYVVLYPQINDYFDLNDILMDTYGCGLAMSLLMTFGIKGSENIQPIWKRPEFIGLLSMIALVLILAKLCLLAPYKGDSCANTWLVLNKRMTTEPWLRPHPTHPVLYHVMKPLEALIAISCLHIFYLGLDSFRQARNSSSSASAK